MPALGLSIVMVGASFFATLAAGVLVGGLNFVLLGLIIATGIAQLIVLCAMTLVVRLEPARARQTATKAVVAARPALAEYAYERGPDIPQRPSERTASTAAVAEPSAAAFT